MSMRIIVRLSVRMSVNSEDLVDSDDEMRVIVSDRERERLRLMLFCCRLEDGACGRVSASQELIFGGENSRPGEFPFTALIRQNLTRQTESLQVRDSDVAEPSSLMP